MQVKQHQVIKVARLLGPESTASANDFVVDSGRYVDFDIIWSTQACNITPYCVDGSSREVLLVQVNTDVNLPDVFPFFYHAQRMHAQQVYRLSLGQFYQLANQLPDFTSQCGFLFSTGRCGSTLLGQLFDASSDVQTLSEPDIYSQVVVSKSFPEREAERLIRACTQVLSYVQRLRQPDKPFLLIKLRGQCTYAGQIFRQACPNSKRLYLYRNAIDVFNSFYVLFPVWLRKLLNVIPLDRWLFSSPLMRTQIEKICPAVLSPAMSGVPLTGFNVIALMWLSNMESALALHSSKTPFFDATLRYEDLKQHPYKQAQRLLDVCQVDQPNRQQLEASMKRNSQQGSRIESKGLNCLTERDVERLQQLLAQHPQVNCADYQLP